MDEAPAETSEPEVLFRQLQVTGREIDVSHSSAVPGELREIGPHAAANLEHVTTGVLRELHDVGHPGRVHPAPMAFDFEKPVESARLELTRVVRPRGVFVPLILDAILVQVSGLN